GDRAAVRLLEGVLAVTPEREMHVTARALLTRRGLREEAGAEAEGRGHLLHGHLQEDGVVGGLQPGPRGDVQLEQPRPGFRVHGAELDPEPAERRREPRHELVEAEGLADAVAEPTRERLAVRVAKAD